MRKALSQKPVYFGLSTVTLIGGVLGLSAANAPEWTVFAYLIALWATLMYLLRWRKR
jgi:hypothetical protein